MAIIRLDHVGVVAHSLEEATDVLVDRLGFVFDAVRSRLPEGGYFAPENARIFFVAIGVGETRIEILLPQDRLTGMGRFLEKRGPGVHHLCYAVDDVAEEARRLRDRGMLQVDLPPSVTAAFFYPKTALGILTELISRPEDRVHAQAAPGAAAP